MALDFAAAMVIKLYWDRGKKTQGMMETTAIKASTSLGAVYPSSPSGLYQHAQKAFYQSLSLPKFLFERNDRRLGGGGEIEK
jgi:hypothetical protein